MRFSNHIANRLFADTKLIEEIVVTMYPKAKGFPIEELPENEVRRIVSLWEFMENKGQKAFLITSTVIEKLDMLKVKPDASNKFDWTVFYKRIQGKYTFVLPPDSEFAHGRVIRILRSENTDVLEIVIMRAKKNSEEKARQKGTDTELLWTFFFVNTKTNEHSQSCMTDKNVADVQEFIYKLLCFVFLSENEYELIKPGESRGTKKNGKIKNDLPVPITIINSKWNITSIRTEGFLVRGHFALRRVGVGRAQTRVVYIEPFEKNGYVRRAQNKEKL